MSPPIPYCGLPPAPSALAERWNLDLILIGVMLAILGAYWLAARRVQLPTARMASFGAGWLIALLALISPLCALSVSLFSARIGQHMILTLLAAPLIAWGLPAIPRGERAILPSIAFLALLWFWHAPAPYAATFASPLVYWAMHISLVGSAIWLWAGLLNGPPAAGRLGAAAISMLQMGFLGALLTLAPRALYGPHQLTTAAWGLTPLQDQQLGGALMWAPGGLTFLVVGLLIGRRWLSVPRGAVLQAAE